jgi:toxin ParE1/3/4
MRSMKLEWSIFAQTDREEIFDYIAADSPRAAVTVDKRIQSQVETLARFPRRGRTGRVEGTRELVILHMPYIVAYRITDDTVRVLHVLHGARRWPQEMSEDPHEWMGLAGLSQEMTAYNRMLQ